MSEIEQTTRKRKPGGGRKKAASTILREKIQEQQFDNAQKCLDLILQMAFDPETKPDLRVHCAESYADRILGKPRQVSEITGKDGIQLAIQILMPAQINGEAGKTL